jgi:hypothetical protein
MSAATPGRGRPACPKRNSRRWLLRLVGRQSTPPTPVPGSIQGTPLPNPLPRSRLCRPASRPLRLAASSRFASPDGSATWPSTSSLRSPSVSPPDAHRRLNIYGVYPASIGRDNGGTPGVDLPSCANTAQRQTRCDRTPRRNGANSWVGENLFHAQCRSSLAGSSRRRPSH